MEVKNFLSKMFGVFLVMEDESGEIWFVAGEVAQALGYQNLSDAILRHTSPEDRKTLNFRDYRETRLSKLWEFGDFRPKTLINESGVYCMIFGSKLDSAKEFKHWVTSFVLPSIRRHGGYIEGQEGLGPEEQEEILEELKALQDKITYLQKRRHALRAQLLKHEEDKRQLKAQRRKLVRSNDAYKKAYDEQLDLYMRVLSEYAELENASYKARKEERGDSEPERPVHQEEKRRVVRVDACGFIIS